MVLNRFIYMYVMCTLQQSADQLLSKLTILGGHVEEEPQFQVEKDVNLFSGQQHIDYFHMTLLTRHEQWCSSFVISLVDLSLFSSQQCNDYFHTTGLTRKEQWCYSMFISVIDVGIFVVNNTCTSSKRPSEQATAWCKGYLQLKKHKTKPLNIIRSLKKHNNQTSIPPYVLFLDSCV